MTGLREKNYFVHVVRLSVHGFRRLHCDELAIDSRQRHHATQAGASRAVRALRVAGALRAVGAAPCSQRPRPAMETAHPENRTLDHGGTYVAQFCIDLGWINNHAVLDGRAH